MTIEHSYSRNTMVLERDVVHLYAEIVIGASGAITSANGGALKSAVKQVTAGQYTISLDSGFQKLLHANVNCINSVATGIGNVDILQDPASVTANLKSGGTITLQCYSNAGAATNPASGTVLKVKLEVRRTTVGPFD